MTLVRQLGAAGSALAMAGLVALAPALPTPPANARNGSDWAMGGRDLDNTRANPDERLLSPSTVGELAVAWTVTTDGDVSATPAVVDGAVYFPDWGGTFWKVDAASGEVIWSHSVAEYAGQKSGEFWMLDASTGEIIWSADVGPGSVLGGIEWGTANDGERIFFAETNNDREPYQLPSGRTIDYSSFGALDAATGEVIWQVPEPHGGLAVGPATTANGVVYYGALNG